MSFKELIGRRRRQLLVHSYIYYRMNTNIISDDQWDAWANELIQLQTDHPKESAQAPLFEEFKTFDGHTGFDLPLHGNYLERVGQRIVSYKPKDLCYYKNVPKIYKEELHMSKAKWLEESTTLELLLEVEKVTEDKRALKAIEELKERAPEDVQGPIALFKQIIELAEKGIEEYQTEVEEIAEFEEEDSETLEEEEIDEEEIEEEELEDGVDLDGLTVKELRAMARELEVFERGMKKAELIEAISGVEDDEELDDEDEFDEEELEEEDDFDDEEEDLEDMSISELRTIARELGVFERGMKRDELIEAIEDEEFEDEDEFDDEIDYEDMTLKELKSEARERGIRVTRKMDEDDIIDLLEEDDEI